MYYLHPLEVFFTMSLLTVSLSLLAAVQAATVHPVQTTGGCSSLPQYDSTTGIAGPWTITVDQCQNTTATDNVCSMEGFGNEAIYFLQQGDTGVEKGYVCFTCNWPEGNRH